MDKQEMAEWLAKNVLGWEYCAKCKVWVSDGEGRGKDRYEAFYDSLKQAWDK